MGPSSRHYLRAFKLVVNDNIRLNEVVSTVVGCKYTGSGIPEH